MMDTFACGAIFGAALVASGVHQPYVIVSQLALENFHMLESFLTAAASSVLFVSIAQRAGHATFGPRSYSSLGLLGRLDGNVTGGLLQGVGMALSGSCAGTVFAQTGAGLGTGFYALGGGMLGGVLWSSTVRPLCRRCTKRAAAAAKPVPPLAIDERLGIGRTTALATFEAFAAAAVGAAGLSTGARTRGLVSPVAGGALIGMAQLVSIAARKTMLGTSTSFEEFGDYVCWVARRAGGGGGADGAGAPKPPPYKNMAFVAAMALGAFFVSWAFPQARATVPVNINPFRSVLGGALIAVGSRMGGGCTSGHGISGISLLSVSSFVTVACMFAGGIGTALALGS